MKRVTTRVARAIPHALRGFIRWPTPEQFLNENVPAFNAKGPIKGIGLALDGTYVVLERAPSFRFDPKAYFNHKLRYAVQVQAACDHRRRFLDITAGWPGSVHDARVFANSYLGQNLERLLPPGYVLSQRVAHFTHLLVISGLRLSQTRHSRFHRRCGCRLLAVLRSSRTRRNGTLP